MTVPVTDVHALRRLRRLGTTGALMAAGAALGAGALPVPNPLFGLRVLGLPRRRWW
ncbi:MULTISPECIES: hypothetical protein [unclassified Pseudonocardia]|jgi:alpha-1,6-mannosyltransferase|uniref:hypothetical protein n=1 Tax=unclassified Pseudonocardia TaxID=2619320 RepID=UPI001AC81C97|nr:MULTISPECIES: hypothetical protein [unclassified Pseudonocardia]MBN9096773.1 hypothetical protein [Pseudonocardia sp.]